MIYVACAVRDSAMDGFALPFFVPSRGVAIRSFQDEVNNPQSPMRAHPEDYELFAIGTYDDSDARFVLHDRPLSLMRAADVVKPEA